MLPEGSFIWNATFVEMYRASGRKQLTSTRKRSSTILVCVCARMVECYQGNLGHFSSMAFREDLKGILNFVHRECGRRIWSPYLYELVEDDIELMERFNEDREKLQASVASMVVSLPKIVCPDADQDLISTQFPPKTTNRTILVLVLMCLALEITERNITDTQAISKMLLTCVFVTSNYINNAVWTPTPEFYRKTALGIAFHAIMYS